MGGGLYALKELYLDPPSVLSTGLSIKMALTAILGGVRQRSSASSKARWKRAGSWICGA